MADEVFALSPISARAALPSEQDYDAIRDAFMETSRGRWFLGEFAKRNRNADTTMVLDAVARIEQTMAAQKQEPARNDDLREVLAAIRSAVEQAQATASGAFADLALAEKLAPIHKGTRIIREISWRWREIGADGRICDMIDSQLVAIEASCTEIAGANGDAALGVAFDLLKHKLDQLADVGEAPAEVKAETNAKANVTTTAEVAVAAAPVPQPAAAKTAAADRTSPKTTFAEPELPAETPLSEVTIVEPEATPLETAVAAPEIKPEAMNAQAASGRDLRQVLEGAPKQGQARDIARPDDLAHDQFAQDEAVLEMVAMEMAAPDDSLGDFFPEIAEVQHTLPPAVTPVAAQTPEPPASRPSRLEIAPSPQILAEPAPPVAPEPSLGSTLLASGILPRPKPPSDPLAPLRRMSQAEKIAFFS